MLVDFRTNCGQLIELSSLHVGDTYAGLLEGRPSVRVNDFLLRGILSQVGRIWEHQPIHFIPPDIDVSKPDGPRLPSIWLAAELLSHQPLNNDRCASGLVVVWFQDQFPERSMSAVVAEVVQTLNWRLLAKDFDW